MGPENLLSARERLERKGRLERWSERVAVRVSEERSIEVTWRWGPVQVMPCQEQCVVDEFHEMREWVGSSVMEEDLNESKVLCSEM